MEGWKDGRRETKREKIERGESERERQTERERDGERMS